MTLKIALALVVAILLCGIGLGFYNSIPRAAPTPMQTTTPTATKSVTIGTTTITVEVEDTEASRSLGLSGRTSLPAGRQGLPTGMLFVFEQPGMYGFWMKDMNFDIDMIFADASGRIVTIARNATAASYHLNPPQVFYPSSPALYVLEVPAGFAASHGIEEGMELKVRP